MHKQKKYVHADTGTLVLATRYTGGTGKRISYRYCSRHVQWTRDCTHTVRGGYAMTDKPSTPNSLAHPMKPVRLLREDRNTLFATETPPKTPKFVDTDLNSLDTSTATNTQTQQPWFNESPANHLAPLSTLSGPIPAVNGKVDNIGDFATQISEAVTPLASTEARPVNIQQRNQAIYGNTSYDRRLAKRQRIEEKKLNWRDLGQFAQFITPFKWQIALAFALTVAIGLTALPMPYIFHVMLDQVFPARDIPLFVWLLAMLLGVFILAEVLSYLNRNILGSLSRDANLKIIYRFYHHMLRLPLSFYQGLSSTGQVLSRLNEVTSAQQTVIQVLIDISVNGVLAVIYVAVLFFTNWQLTLAVLAAAPFYLGVSFYFNRRMRHLSRQVLESYAVMNGAMYEGLTGLKTVKALAAEHRFGRKIKKLVMITNNFSFRRTIFQSEANLIIGIVQDICSVAILCFGGYLVLSGYVLPGALAAYV